MVLLLRAGRVSHVGNHSAPEAPDDRSGSRRTVESYSRMLWPFFAERSLTPDRVKPGDVLAWVHGIGRSGRTPSSTTVGARIACLSSFYRFLIRMGLVVSNPCDAVERPRSVQSVARGYSADEVRRLLAVVRADTVAGRRDRAILLTLVLTGRLRAEVIDSCQPVSRLRHPLTDSP